MIQQYDGKQAASAVFATRLGAELDLSFVVCSFVSWVVPQFEISED